MNQNDASTQINSDNQSIMTQTQANNNENIVESNFSNITDMNNSEKSNIPFGGIFSNDDEGKSDSKEINEIENKNQENDNKEKIDIDFRFLASNDILWKNCKKQFKYVINFNNYKYINAECQCQVIKNKPIKQFFDEEITSRIKTTYLYYCKDCEVHLKPDDVDEKAEYNNDYGEIKNIQLMN